MASGLRQNVLRSNARAQDPSDESDEEWVNVQTDPGTPALSRPGSPGPGGSRAASRTRTSAAARKNARDPLRALPTELNQRIFGGLGLRDLARCARVSKKWARSQTLNYVWFQLYRADNYQDASLPPGKWTKRESKQNWRTTYIASVSSRDNDAGHSRPYLAASGYSSAGSGHRTPKEANEERWQAEAEPGARPDKVAMREMYKELGGRKAKGKTKFGRAGETGARNVGGLGGDYDE